MDFAKPIHPAEVAAYIAANLAAKAKRLRHDIAILEAQVATLEQAAWDAETDADRWRKYQPDPSPAARADAPS